MTCDNTGMKPILIYDMATLTNITPRYSTPESKNIAAFSITRHLFSEVNRDTGHICSVKNSFFPYLLDSLKIIQRIRRLQQVKKQKEIKEGRCAERENSSKERRICGSEKTSKTLPLLIFLPELCSHAGRGHLDFVFRLQN